MNYPTDEFDVPFNVRHPQPVDTMGAQLTKSQSDTITYNGKAAAGAISVNPLPYRNIFNPLGDRIGSYWRLDDNFVYGTSEPDSGVPISGRNLVSVTKTDTAADVIINDIDNNLELLFESLTTTVKRYVIEVEDTSGNKLTGWIFGVAASGNIYTIDIAEERVVETQTWVEGDATAFDETSLKSAKIYAYQSSLSFGTGTTFTKEVGYPQEYANSWRQTMEYALLLSNGEFFVDYMRGMLVGKRADNTASETVTYNIEVDASVAVSVTGVSANMNIDKVGGTATVTGGVNGSLGIGGNVAHDAVDAGNPVAIGGIAKSAQQTAVATGDRVKGVFNLFGELVLAGYTWATNSLRTEEIDPIDEHYVEEELVDDTDLSAATRYYPSSTGKAMGNFNNMSIQLLISGGVTMTVEAKNDDSTDWVDITKSGTNMNLNTAAHASYADMGTIVNFTNLRVRNVRIKSVTADATNGVQYHTKYTAL